MVKKESKQNKAGKRHEGINMSLKKCAESEKIRRRNDETTVSGN
ncbi:MAG: hypothetical protein Q4C61_12390 [Lachnospiraceae bacterium]|nr:hypothetical protein [Lachnospiraceae bacterium]